jgi:hypothetical protein
VTLLRIALETNKLWTIERAETRRTRVDRWQLRPERRQREREVSGGLLPKGLQLIEELVAGDLNRRPLGGQTTQTAVRL